MGAKDKNWSIDVILQGIGGFFLKNMLFRIFILERKKYSNEKCYQMVCSCT